VTRDFDLQKMMLVFSPKDEKPPHACRVHIEDLHVAYHSAEIVSNGWEPYDQPDHAAYLPYARADLASARLRSGGVVFVRKSKTHRSPPSRTTKTAIARRLRQGGTPAAAVRAALRLMG
jgi:hypothetical protein